MKSFAKQVATTKLLFYFSRIAKN